jgi:hypothetical protein
LSQIGNLSQKQEELLGYLRQQQMMDQALGGKQPPSAGPNPLQVIGIRDNDLLLTQLHNGRLENARLKEHINCQNRQKLQMQSHFQRQIAQLKAKLKTKDQNIAKLKKLCE